MIMIVVIFSLRFIFVLFNHMKCNVIAHNPSSQFFLIIKDSDRERERETPYASVGLIIICIMEQSNSMAKAFSDRDEWNSVRYQSHLSTSDMNQDRSQ